MTDYEKLLDVANNANITVYDNFDLDGTRLKGFYCDNNIVLDKKISTQSEKSCILAEELGHHYTTTGNILDTSKGENRKQELKARLWAYNERVGLNGIIECYKARCMNINEMAEKLNVTEAFLKEAIEAYHNKYGIYTKVDNYIIGFEPNLYVIEWIQDPF